MNKPSGSVFRSCAGYADIVRSKAKFRKVSILSKVTGFLDEVETDKLLNESKFDEQRKNI